jgi:hypothetical protein
MTARFPIRGPEGSGVTTLTTVDTGESYKLIALHNGTVKAVPADALAPAKPASLVAGPKLTYCRLSWAVAARAVKYRVYRDGVEIAQTTSPLYLDPTVVAGATYSYRVAGEDQYGQIGPSSDPASAFIDPTLNVAPSSVQVTWWPPEMPTTGYGYIRVNATDLDVQVLAHSLSVDVGALTPTPDPTKWLYLAP